MKTFFSQLLGMLRYEVVMQMRRRTFVLIMLGLVGGIFAFAMSQRVEQTALQNSLASIAAELGVPLAELQYVQVTLVAVATLLGTTLLLGLVVVPVLVAPTIPLDQHYGIRPLFESLPLSRGTYLLGKVGSIWLNLSLLMIIWGLGAGSVILRLVLGPFDWGFYLLVWLVMLGMLLIIAGLGVLLAAGQPTMRRAMLVGVGLTAYLLFWTIRSMNTAESWIAFSPIQLPALADFVSQQIKAIAPDLTGMAQIGSWHQSIGAMFAAASTTLLVVWALAWVGNRWKIWGRGAQ